MAPPLFNTIEIHALRCIMSKSIFGVGFALVLVSGVQAQNSVVSGVDTVYVVRFKDSALPQVRPGSVRDERAAQDPQAWSYLSEQLLGHIQALEKRYGVRAEAAFGSVFRGMSVRLKPAQLERLRRDPSVDRIEADQVYGIGARPSRGGSTSTVPQIVPWGITQTLANQSYTLAGNGTGVVSGVRAYVIDTGIDTAHTDLNRIGLVNFVGDRKNTDCNGHGTHVAGTIAAYDNTSDVVGVAPGVMTYGVKVLDCNGSGTTTSVIKGIDWVAVNAVKPAVVNMSLGGGASQLLDDAVRATAAKGIVFTIAAGNASVNACTSSPARTGGGATPGVLVVAATDSSDVEASFSNYGSCVDIWAPGVGVASLKVGGGVATLSGTSMAAPHAGGAAALLQGRYPTISHDSVVSTLRQMAVSTGTRSKDGCAIIRLNANIQ
jgi:subtilisin family serine protease